MSRNEEGGRTTPSGVGFTKSGDIIVDHGWVVSQDFGHLTHGYVLTSHASQGVTVDKVFIGVSAESFPATYQRTAYVAVTRGKEQAQIFTDDKQELFRVVSRPDDPMSATQLAESTKHDPPLQDRPTKPLTRARRHAAIAAQNQMTQPAGVRNPTVERGMDHDR